MSTIDISVSHLIEAPAAEVYAIVSEVENLGRLSPENESSTWIDAGAGAEVGRRFRGTNRVGWLRWTTKPVVTVAERGRRFAFRVPMGALSTWTYELDEIDGGTLVTESVRTERTAPRFVGWLMARVGVTDREAHLRAGMTETLARLAAEVGSRRAVAAS